MDTALLLDLLEERIVPIIKGLAEVLDLGIELIGLMRELGEAISEVRGVEIGGVVDGLLLLLLCRRLLLLLLLLLRRLLGRGGG